MPQGGQILHREKAPQCQGGIQARGGMALAQHKTIPTLPFGILGIYVHFLEIQIGEHICRGQAAAGMAGFGTMGRFDDTHAHLAGSHPQLLLFIGGQRNHFLIYILFWKAPAFLLRRNGRAFFPLFRHSRKPETMPDRMPGKRSRFPLAAFCSDITKESL